MTTTNPIDLLYEAKYCLLRAGQRLEVEDEKVLKEFCKQLTELIHAYEESF